MSRVKGSDTGLEKLVQSELRRHGYRFRKHVRTLPGRPDIVFHREKVAVFVDGDFWHGYRFAVWERKLSTFWRNKISLNRQRDVKNHRKLRAAGWKVIRIWGHEVKSNLGKSIQRIKTAVLSKRARS